MAATISTANCTHASAGSNGTALSCSYPVANTAGATLIAFVGAFHLGAATLNPPTDFAGNVWQRVSSAESTNDGANGVTCSMFYAPNCAGSTNTVTSSSPSSPQMSMWIGEIAGAGTASLDVSGSTSGNSSAQTHASLTITSAGCVFVTGIADLNPNSSGFGWTSATGSTGLFSSRPEWNVLTGATSQRIAGCSRNSGSSGLARAISTGLTASTNWVSVSAAFGTAAAVVVRRPTFTLMGAGR